MSEPVLQPDATLEPADVDHAVEIAVIKPSIAVLQSAKGWYLFLAKDTILEPSVTHLRGVRLVQIPRGWRLSLIQLLCPWISIHLPDEFDYCDVEIERDLRCPILRADGDFMFRLNGPSPILPLTHLEYSELMAFRGRDLYSWITVRFPKGTCSVESQQKVVRRSAA